MRRATNQSRKVIRAIIATTFILGQVLVSFVFNDVPVHAQDGAACQGLVDIVLTLDNSGSIEDDENAALKQASHDLIDSFSYDATTGAIMGITRFRTGTFSVTNMTVSTPTLHAGVDGIPSGNGGTDIVNGLNGASAHFATGLGDRDGAGGTPDAPNVNIYISDGNDNNDNSQSAIQNASSNSAADEIYAIGVGSSVSLETLQSIAKPSDAAHVYLVDNFDPDLVNLVNLIALEACPLDLGDLPPTFPTLRGIDGPRHAIGNLFLGETVDAEVDGQPNSDSTGDDNAGIDDEDGIFRNNPQSVSDNWIPGNTVRLTVTVTGNNGHLWSWFDWNNNAVLTDTNEVVDLGKVVSGTQVVTLTVPAQYTTGQELFVRFRLYAGNSVSPKPVGIVSNGEVEDYTWYFGPTAITMSAVEAREISTVLPWIAVSVLVLSAVSVYLFRRGRRTNPI